LLAQSTEAEQAKDRPDAAGSCGKAGLCESAGNLPEKKEEGGPEKAGLF